MDKKIKVYSYSAEQYDSSFPPSNLKLFIEHFSKILGSIPEAYRDQAEIEVGSHSQYDCHYAEIEVSYTRPETAEEQAARADNERVRIEQHERREREVLSQLKAKYGG